jgi:hypothetical protein
MTLLGAYGGPKMENRGYGSARSIRRTGLTVLVVSLLAVAGYVAGSVLLAGDEDDEHYSLADTFLVSSEGSKGAYLGVQLSEEIDHPEGGARITRVVDESPADESGLQRGDIVVAIGGDVVRGPGALTKKIREREPGDRVTLTVIRDGDRVKLDVELGERPGLRAGAWILEDGEVRPLDSLDEEKLQEYRNRMKDWSERYGETLREYGERFRDKDLGGVYRFYASPRPKLGVQLVEATPELREHLGGKADAGVLVSKVVADSAAERAGVLVGDLIIAADGEPVEDSGDLVRALMDKSDEEIVLILVRDGRKMEIEAFIPKPDEDDVTGPRALLETLEVPMPPMPEMPALPAMPELPELLVLPELPELPALDVLEDLDELIHVPEPNLEIRRLIEEEVRRAQEVNRETLRARAREREVLLEELRREQAERSAEHREAREAYEAAMRELREARQENLLEAREEYERARIEAMEALKKARRGESLLEI